MKKTPLIKVALPLALLLPLMGSAAPHGQANPNVDALDSEHQVNMAKIVNRNQDNVNADPTITIPDWFKKITVSGVVDPAAVFGFGGRPSPVAYVPTSPTNPAPQNTGTGGPSQSLGIFAAELYFDAQVADWVLVHTTLAYDMNFNDAANYASGYSATGPGVQSQTLFVEEAAVTLANFEKSPYWLTVGRQFLPFGSYKHHTLLRPLTQYLSEANNVAATVGAVQPFNDINLYADLYAFQGFQAVAPIGTTQSQTIPGWGANIGLNKESAQASYNVNIGVINNMINAYLIGNACNPLREPGGTNGTTNGCTAGSYNTQTPGLALHFDGSSGPFTLYADYVTAMTAFSGADLPSGNNPISTASPGAKPWAYSLQGMFHFPTFIRNHTYDSRAILSFEQSGDAVNVSSATVLWGYWMPQYRYAVGYGIDPVKNVSVRLQYQYDVDYATSAGGTGLSANSLLADLKVVF